MSAFVTQERTATQSPAQLKTAPDSQLSMSPPEFSLSADTSGPVQMQENGDGGTEQSQQQIPDGQDFGMMVGPLQAFDVDSAVTYNNGKEFRIDWVRNLQLRLLGERRSTDGSFDQETIHQVARFQSTYIGSDGVDGKIGPTTRRKLEEIYPELLSTITGDHLDSRVLVPAGASQQQRYAYWAGIIQESGGHFLTGGMEINLLGIRGVKIADGTESHQVGGQTLASGTIYQTSSAQDFVNARAAGTTDDHVSGRHQGFDDMIISLWVDGEGNMVVKERIGNVDPRSLYTDDSYGTGHLMDGQYQYHVGTHGTGSSSHRDAVKGIEDPDNVLGIHDYKNGTRTRYNALRPSRNQEVWREHETNDRYVSAEEERVSRERIYDRNGRYTNDNFAMNIHTSSTEHPNSQACMNVPADNYLEFMKEIYAGSNQQNVLFSLIDASKIENGLVLQSQTNQ